MLKVELRNFYEKNEDKKHVFLWFKEGVGDLEREKMFSFRPNSAVKIKELGEINDDSLIVFRGDNDKSTCKWYNILENLIRGEI